MSDAPNLEAVMSDENALAQMPEDGEKFDDHMYNLWWCGDRQVMRQIRSCEII